MKNITWVLAVVITALLIIGFRYSLVVNSPIVAKIDRISGEVWIANSGKWVKVQHPAEDKAAMSCASPVEKTNEKAEQAATK